MRASVCHQRKVKRAEKGSYIFPENTSLSLYIYLYSLLKTVYYEDDVTLMNNFLFRTIVSAERFSTGIPFPRPSISARSLIVEQNKIILYTFNEVDFGTENTTATAAPFLMELCENVTAK